MYRKTVVTIFSFFILAAFCCGSAFALGGGGLRNEAALDAEANGMVDAFVAQADSVSAVHFNPAGLTQLKGNHVRVGTVVEAPRNSYTSTSGNESQMQMQTFAIPSVYLANDFGWEGWKLGLGVNAPYGLGTDWADDSFSRYQATESDLEFYQINPTVAYEVNDMLSVGVGIDYMMAYVSKRKRLTAAAGEGEFHLKGDDDGWGYNIGVLYKPSDKHSFGASYRSEIPLTYEGHGSLTNMDAGAYAALFPDTYVTGMESKLTLPQTLAVGYAYKPNDRWTFEFDYEWTDWSSLHEDFVKFTDETDSTRLAVLNDGNPAPKDWQSSFAYGIGIKYEASTRVTLRGGYAFIETPIPSANFETALPGSDKHCVSFGLGYSLREDLVFDASYFGVFFVDRDVTNDVASSSSDLDGEYKGYVNIVSTSLTYKY